MRVLHQILVFTSVAIALSVAQASVPQGKRLQAELDKKNLYIEKGAVVGGEAGITHSLLGVRRFFSKADKVERVVLDLGDGSGQPLRGRVSYFQATIDPDQQRILIDLSQMGTTAVTQEALQKTFRGSPFVKTSKLTFDPADGGMTLELKLKTKVKMEVFRLPSADKASRIVLDLASR